MATTFYPLAEQDNEQEALLVKVCQLCGDLYGQGLRVFVATNDVKTAEQLDELMWKLPSEQFIPHNLQGEGPHYGAPIEIGHQPPQTRRQVLINLCHPLPQFAVKFTQIIDFIPNDPAHKQQARERFHHYRQLNLAPQMATE
ncbi:MAG: DNA polymerase III subunit chi [Psychrobium sp.]